MKSILILFSALMLSFSAGAFAGDVPPCNFGVQVSWSNEMATSYRPIGNCDDLPGSTVLECRNEAKKNGYTCFQVTNIVYATGFVANSCWGCLK